MIARRSALSVLALDTFAFTACFALWMLNGVLVTHLVETQTFAFDAIEVGWLLGAPVLTGSLLRLPVGMLTDRYGGRRVFSAVLVASALGALLLGRAETFAGFLVGSLAFGLAGTSFAVGVAHTSAWFPKQSQGTALGIFGAGNAGSALTTVFAPALLRTFTENGANPDGWRRLPLVLAGLMFVTAVAFFVFVPADRMERPVAARSLGEQLGVLRSIRVWRFGLYYFLVFGCFVALAQWLVPYYVNVFGVTLATAGLLTAVFSFPSGVIRALGGWLSDRYGARRTLYGVFGVCVAGCFFLAIPRMQLTTPGEGVSARFGGVVTRVTEHEIVAGGFRYDLRSMPPPADDAGFALSMRQVPLVRTGEVVKQKQLLASGTTTLVFAPGIGLFTFLVFAVGIAMGIGKAAVYKHIPDYFPGQVGAVGGLVGVVGGLGGFFCPIVFGYLLRWTGVWSSAWAFLFLLSLGTLAWMHSVVRSLERARLRSIEATTDAPRELALPLGREGAVSS